MVWLRIKIIILISCRIYTLINHQSAQDLVKNTRTSWLVRSRNKSCSNSSCLPRIRSPSWSFVSNSYLLVLNFWSCFWLACFICFCGKPALVILFLVIIYDMMNISAIPIGIYMSVRYNHWVSSYLQGWHIIQCSSLNYIYHQSLQNYAKFH